MSRFVFDIETNGLLNSLDRVHSLVLKDIDTGEVISCADQAGYRPVEEGVRLLAEAEQIVGHNIIRFDIPALKKVYPWFDVEQGRVRDTMVWSRLIYPKDDLRDRDFKTRKKTGIPGKLTGSHSLEAWGYRLRVYKGDFGKETHNSKDDETWAYWSREMQDYCEQDVEVTYSLHNKLVTRSTQIEKDGKPAFSEQSIDLEHRVAWIVARQERYGFAFDVPAAEQLCAVLMGRRAELETELQKAFPPRWRPKGEFTPKRSNRKMGYVEGCPFSKVEYTPFNPGSRQHVAEWLQVLRGWEPQEFTNDGHPKVNETTLSGLPYPEAKLLAEYFMVGKRLGQLAEGDNAWLKMVDQDGRIHGSVNTNGAVTGRMTHAFPNIAQVPGSKSPYGHECRALFTVPKEKKLVGCDADSLELRCLAGYMARYDGGEYIKVVLQGDKSQGTDNHSVNCRALGMDPKAKYPMDGKEISGRDIAKTWFYAFIYGAGDWTLGFTMGKRGKDAAIKKAGKTSRSNFLKNLPALGTLTNKVKGKVKKQGFLRGLDGRKLRIRSDHAALNTLLQSAGAIIMKQALVILDDDLQAAGYVPGLHYEFVANVHDEWQIESDEGIAEHVGQIAKDSIRKAGEVLGFRCPLDGSFDIGMSWAETH